MKISCGKYPYSHGENDNLEVNMINTASKIGWEGGGSKSIWIMSLNIRVFFSGRLYSIFVKNNSQKNALRFVFVSTVENFTVLLSFQIKKI